MNREIEFRGKLSHSGAWVFGSLLKIDKSYHILRDNDMYKDVHHVYQESDCPTWVAPDTVCQFAGLVDKNGVKIFEGDWVLLEGVGIFNVRYSTSMCQFGLYGKRGFVDALKELQEDRYVVVGNVYDNPELLATK